MIVAVEGGPAWVCTARGRWTRNRGESQGEGSFGLRYRHRVCLVVRGAATQEVGGAILERAVSYPLPVLTNLGTEHKIRH